MNAGPSFTIYSMVCLAVGLAGCASDPPAVTVTTGAQGPSFQSWFLSNPGWLYTHESFAVYAVIVNAGGAGTQTICYELFDAGATSSSPMDFRGRFDWVAEGPSPTGGSGGYPSDAPVPPPTSPVDGPCFALSLVPDERVPILIDVAAPSPGSFNLRLLNDTLALTAISTPPVGTWIHGSAIDLALTAFEETDVRGFEFHVVGGQHDTDHVIEVTLGIPDCGSRSSAQWSPGENRTAEIAGTHCFTYGRPFLLHPMRLTPLDGGSTLATSIDGRLFQWCCPP